MEQTNRYMRKRDEYYVVFKARMSLLEELYSTSESARALILMAAVAIVLYFVSYIVQESLDSGTFYWKTPFISGLGTTLKDYVNGFLIEAVLLTLGFLFYPVFTLWVTLYKSLGRLVNIPFIIFYSAVIIATFIGMVWASRAFVIPPLMGVILSIEQLRFCFKTYVFIRENAYKVIYQWHKDDTDGPASWYQGQMSPSVGSFTQYCYFLFCPTLLYRDHYPRNSGPIRWNRVLLYVFVFYLPTEVAAYMWTKHATPSTINSSEMISTFIFSTFASLISYVLGLTSLMHGWMNLGAELTGFADRQFYTDYWNCTNYFQFYRKWNVIPHHFIHQYVLRDLRKIIPVKILAHFLALLGSSLIHEYVISFGVGYLIPVLTIFFAGVGIIIFKIWPKNELMQRLLFVVSLGFGAGTMMWVNLVELQARKLCPREEDFYDLFLPRFIGCYGN